MTGYNELQVKFFEAVAGSLREFGYPSCTAEHVRETYEALLEGKRGAEQLPYGVVSAFAEDQLRVAVEKGLYPDYRTEEERAAQ